MDLELSIRCQLATPSTDPLTAYVKDRKPHRRISSTLPLARDTGSTSIIIIIARGQSNLTKKRLTGGPFPR